MDPVRLVIQDFSCHNKSEIDFEKFNSALIVGKVCGNDHYSNGVGKSSIFKAMEYVLFNQSDTNLEKVIRDDAKLCKVILYFKNKDILYRISRSRNKKDVSDLSLHVRTGTQAPTSDIFIDSIDKDNIIWKDISSRRTADTEEDIYKIIKCNYKMFRNAVHFAQNDISGLATLTAEKRKSLLKEVFQLLIYSKLEKLSKEKSSSISKEIDKLSAILYLLSSTEEDIKKKNENLIKSENILLEKNEILSQKQLVMESLITSINNHTNLLSNFEEKTKSIKEKEKTLIDNIKKNEDSIEQYVKKNNDNASSAKIIIDKSKIFENKLKEYPTDLNDNIIVYEKQLPEIKEKIISKQVDLKSFDLELKKLKIPLPEGEICESCRQTLYEKDKIICKNKIDARMHELELSINSTTENIADFTKQQANITSKILNINELNKEISKIKENVSSLKKDIEIKKELHKEYQSIIFKYRNETAEQKVQLHIIQQELHSYDPKEELKIKHELDIYLINKDNISKEIFSLNKEISHFNNSVAVSKNDLEKLNIDLIKKQELFNNIKELQLKNADYLLVTEAFSSSGIPHLIIDKVLIDLQNESNILLDKIRPGLQLSFNTEKTRSDGLQEDTLDIKYSLDNNERYYYQLSGAQQLSVSFSLKFGMSLLLQKTFGADIKLLLLDEIDQSLDKAGVDAFVDIVKSFQNDFKILVITHNDRIKDKFSHAIVVEKNNEGSSSAQVMSSW